MEFLVIAHDYTDDEALLRRLVVRERQLAAARRAVESGSMLIGGPILDEGGRMVGSMIVASFPNRIALDNWLQGLPFVRNEVWEKIEVYPYEVSVMASPDLRVEEYAKLHEATPDHRQPQSGEASTG